MIRKFLTSHVLSASLATLLLACGTSDEESTAAADDTLGPDEPGENGSAASGCDPNDPIPCFEGIAEPCPGLESGFPGDDYCRAAPDPSVGLQLHVGPTDYTDPDDYGRFIIEPGEETNWAEVTRFPNDTTVYTQGYYSYMRPGSHHFILFAMPEDTEVGSQSNDDGFGAVGAVGGEFLAGATRQIQTAVLNSDHPDDRGLASEVVPHRPVAVNLHFINTSDEPRLQEIWVNFVRIEEEEVVAWQKPITWYGGLSMAIRPGEHTTLSNEPGGCRPPGEVRITGLTGHVHANTVRYNTTLQRAGEPDRILLFEDYDWAEPTEFRYTPGAPNPEIDPEAGVAGGYTGFVHVTREDRLFWECEVRNERDVTLTFSNEVYDGEMCNIFGYYTTDDKNASPWLCAF